MEYTIMLSTKTQKNMFIQVLPFVTLLKVFFFNVNLFRGELGDLHLSLSKGHDWKRPIDGTIFPQEA